MDDITLIPLDRDGEEISPRWQKRGKKDTNKNTSVFAIRREWENIVSKRLGIPASELPSKNFGYVVLSAMKRGLDADDIPKLFTYFVSDKGLSDEDKISYHLCLSEIYVAKWKISKKKKNSNFTQVSMAEEIDL